MCRWAERAELLQRWCYCLDLPQLKNFFLSVTSGNLMTSSEAHLIWEFSGWKSLVSVLNILLPRLLFLPLVQKKVVIVGLPFCFRQILIMVYYALKEQLMLIVCSEGFVPLHW